MLESSASLSHRSGNPASAACPIVMARLLACSLKLLQQIAQLPLHFAAPSL